MTGPNEAGTPPRAARLLGAPFLHPLLLAIYPVLALYTVNVGEVATGDVVRPMLVMLGLGAAALALLYAMTRDAHGSALAVSLVLILFCIAWEPVVRPVLFAAGEWLGVGIRYLFAGALAAVLVVLFLLLRKKWLRTAWTPPVNVVAIALVGLAAVNGLYQGLRHAAAEAPVLLPLPDLRVDLEQEKPDVFVIVLDAYGRADVLQEVFGLDNTPFLDAMQARGFWLAPQAETSYAWTNQSLPACLNLDYLENLEEARPDFAGASARARYRNSVAFRLFKELGYHLRAVETGDPLTDPGPECDSVLRYPAKGAVMNPFELALLDRTPAARILQVIGMSPGLGHWRNRLLYLLENLPAKPAELRDRPVFTMAHLICPHQPYVFAADGGPAATENNVFSLTARPGLDPPFEVIARQYADQVQGLNKHILRMVDRIVEEAEHPPFIAVVSDHGPPMQSLYGRTGRMKNLILLYHPALKAKPPRENMNLVELFPVMLNTLFDAGLPMPPAP